MLLLDNKVIVKLIRDDLKEFLIDNETWHLPSDRGLQNFGYFENDIQTIDNAISDGSMIASYRLGTIDRTIVFHNRFARKTNEVLRAQVLSFFSPKHKYRIYVTYMGVTRWCDAMVLKMDLPTKNINWQMEVSVTFLCNNPYLKSFDDFGKDIAEIVPMAGFPYLSEIGKGAPTGYFAYSTFVVLNNDGDTETNIRAVMRAHGEVVNPKLIINRHFVSVLITMHDGDELELDFTKAPPTIKLNGQSVVGRSDKASQFNEMYLSVGDNEASYSADAGTNLLSVSIYYNKLYVGV